MYADAIRRQAEDAPRAALPAVAAALWRALANGQVSEAEAETLSALIEARREAPAKRQGTAGDAVPQDLAVVRAKISTGSRPRTDASLERRRRWAASGRLPPGIAARFTAGEQAVLALVAAETARRKDCRLAIGHMAAIAGVSETTVRNALREGKRLGLLTVEERRVTGWRNDTNVVRVVSAEWTAWLRLARRGVLKTEKTPGRSSSAGGGCNSAKGTPTEVLDLGESRKPAPSQGLPTGGGRPGPMRCSANPRGR